MAGLPSVLVVSRNYPNSILPHQGPWVQRQTHALARRGCQMVVIAPTPYWPPVSRPAEFARFRKVERWRREKAADVHHPRMAVGPGYLTYAFEAASTYAACRRVASRLHRETRFDLIHAHFTYPDGAAAIALGRRLGVPVVITEHVLWSPWMDDHPMVRRQATWAFRHAAATVAVSDAVRRTIAAVVPSPEVSSVIPIGVDPEVFRLKDEADGDSTADRLLFVGWVNHIKGLDILLRSLCVLVRRRPRVRLTIVGGALFRNKRLEQEALLAEVHHLGLEHHVTFAGPGSQTEVSAFMRRSDVLVLPSRRESCGSVLLEALASGTPVVATRSGGPEEIVTEDVGVLSPVGDVEALAAAIEHVLDHRQAYAPARLRQYAVAKYSWDRLADAYLDIYRAVVNDAMTGTASIPPRM